MRPLRDCYSLTPASHPSTGHSLAATFDIAVQTDFSGSDGVRTADDSSSCDKGEQPPDEALFALKTTVQAGSTDAPPAPSTSFSVIPSPDLTGLPCVFYSSRPRIPANAPETALFFPLETAYETSDAFDTVGIGQNPQFHPTFGTSSVDTAPAPTSATLTMKPAMSEPVKQSFRGPPACHKSLPVHTATSSAYLPGGGPIFLN